MIETAGKGLEDGYMDMTIIRIVLDPMVSRLYIVRK